MLVCKAALLAAMSSLVFISTSAAAQEGCWLPNEAKASQIIEFETKLMTGALKCRDELPPLLSHYNSFATKHRDLLQAQYSLLRERFIREERGDERAWQIAYDHYRTSAASKPTSTRTALSGGDCSRLASLARVAGEVSDEELVLLAESMVEASAKTSASCPAPSHLSVGAPALPAGVAVDWRPSGPPPAQQVAAGELAPTQPQMVQPQASQSQLAQPERAQQRAAEEPREATQAGTVQYAGPASSANSSVDRSASPVSQASSDDLLKAAVTALRAATAALELAASPDGTKGAAVAAPAPGAPRATQLQ